MPKLLNFLTNYQRPIDNQPLELDLAIFSRLAELPFQVLLNEVSMAAQLVPTCKSLLEIIQRKHYLSLPADQQLLKQIIQSHRYEKVWISDVVTGPDQFMALTFHLSAQTKVLAFRGPTGTLLSWQADLHFINRVTPTLIQQAQDYVDSALQKDNELIFGVGFSKGASLAALAFNQLDSINNRVSLVTLFDSPGLPVGDYQFNIPMIELVSPLSLFALIGEHPFKQITIDSTNNGIWQHDLYSWTGASTLDGSFARGIGINSNQPENHIFFDLLPQNITLENIEQSIDAIFEIFEKLECSSVSELVKHWNRFTSQIHQHVENDNIVIKMTLQRLQQLIFQNAATNLQNNGIK